MENYTEFRHHNTALPDYMGFTIQNAELFSLSNEQKEQLVALKKIFRPKASVVKQEIEKTGDELLKMSKTDGETGDILVKSEELKRLKIKFSTIKTDCRDELLEVVNGEQWSKIIEKYDREKPYGALSLENTINPWLNLSNIVLSSKSIDLTSIQSQQIQRRNKVVVGSTFSMIVNAVNIEKEAARLSMAKAPVIEVLSMVEEAENLRYDILKIKVECRGFLFDEVLTREQVKLIQKELK